MQEEREHKEKRSAIRRRLKQLRRSYVLALINRRTFEEKGSIKLTPLNLLLLIGGLFLLILVLFFGAVAFTPAKRYLPGFPGQEMEERSIQAMEKADSLEYELGLMKEHFQRMRAVFDSDNGSDSIGEDAPSPSDLSSLDRKKAPKRKRPRKMAGSLLPMQDHFFPPLRGSLTDAFDPPGHHFGVDLTASKGKAIKATLEGTIVFSSWTPKEGKVIQIQHPHGFLSIYKHNSVLLKEAGQKVRTGDPIAIIGNSGSLTTGPHLHFELWYKGDPIDPEKVMIF